jgi:hypothetical protein
MAIGRAQALADLEGVSNARFEVGDVQTYPFQAAGAPRQELSSRTP